MATRRTTRRYRLIRQNLRLQQRPCRICGNTIDYRLPPNHPMSFSAHHLKPWDQYPALREDPSNIDAAHLICNKRQGNRHTTTPLGSNSKDW